MSKSREKSIPHNLPPRVQPCVNREREIEQVSQALLDPHIPIVTIAGLAGIGKTVVALEVAHRRLEQDQFAGGICWVYCQAGDNVLSAILHTVQVTFDLAPMPTLREGVRRYLRTNPCLLILDAYEVVSQDMEVLAFLEQSGGPSRVLLTSREDVHLRGSWALRLAGLPAEDAIRLFLEVAGWYGVKVSSEQVPLVAEICALLDYIPLPIRLVAGYARTERLDAILEGLRDKGQYYHLMATDLRQSQELSFRYTYDLLSEGGRQLWAIMAAIFAGTPNRDAVQAVYGAEADEALDELLDWQVVERTNGQYRMAEVVREFGRARLAELRLDEAELRARHAAHYLDVARETFAVEKYQRGEWAAVEETDGPDIFTAADWAVAELERAEGASVEELLARWKELEPKGSEVPLAGEWAYVMRDYIVHRLPSSGYRWLAGGLVAWCLSKAGEAHARQALLCNELGLIHDARGDYAAALAWYERSVVLQEELGDRAGLAPTYNNIGRVHYARGEYGAALEWYAKSVALEEGLGDRAGLATTYNNIGQVHYARGDYGAALEWYERSVAFQDALGDRAGLATTYNNIANVHYARGEYDAALKWYEKSVSFQEALGDRAGLATTYNNIANVHYARGEYDVALEWYEKSMALKEELGDRAGLATTYNNIASIYYARGDYDVALGWYEKSLALQEVLGDRAGLATTYNNIGIIYSARGDYRAALERYEKSVALEEELGDRAGLAVTYSNIGRICDARGDYGTALEWYERSIALAEELRDRAGLAVAYRAIARVHQRLGDLEASMVALSQALAASLRVAFGRPVLETTRQVVGYGKYLVAQDKYADALTMTTRLSTVLDRIGQEDTMPPSPGDSEARPVLKEPAPTYQAAVSDDLQMIEATTVLKDVLSVIAAVASVRVDGSPSAQYDQALQALELARQVDKITGRAFELADWVREASGYEFVELEEADRWPPRLIYLVHLAVRYERDEDWPAAIEAYRQARALLDPDHGEEELRRYTELGFRLGLCLKQDGRWSEALKQQEENVAEYKKLGNPYGKASAYLEIGHICQMMNVYDLALLYYSESYYLYQQAAERTADEDARQLAYRGMADAKESLGSLEFQIKVLPQALTDLKEAERLYTTLGVPGKAAIVRQTLERAQSPAGGGDHG